MKARLAFGMLCLHAVLLVLASTRFTVVSWLWGNHQWTWSYAQYTYRSGWGYRYESEYTLALVGAYLLAYLVGVVAYALAWPLVRRAWIGLGLGLCLVGVLSFSVESSHWLMDHHLSWIATCPAGSLLLAGLGMYSLHRIGRRAAGRADSPSGIPTA